jgi:hypothetical protein
MAGMLAALAGATPAGAAPEGFVMELDAQRPVVRLDAPDYASDRSHTRAVLVRWTGLDQGSGIARFTLEARLRTNASTRWRVVASGTGSTRASFRGHAGRTYDFRLRARDRFGNLSRYDYDQTVVPLDDRSRRLGLSGGWRPVGHRPAYGHTLTRASGPGQEARLAFRGTAAAVIASRKRRGGRLRVLLDGRERVISLRGRHRHRRVVFRSRLLRPGRHLLRLQALGPGVVDLDGVAVDSGPSPPGNRRR